MLRKQNYELPPNREKELLDHFRCHESKEFFKAAKTVIKQNKTATVAKAFRTDDPLVTIPIEKYIEAHFRNPKAPNTLKIPEDAGHCLTISAEELAQATKNLASNKAVGVDMLNDITLKRHLKESNLLCEKVRKQMERWLNGRDTLPDYLAQARTCALSKEEKC